MRDTHIVALRSMRLGKSMKNKYCCSKEYVYMCMRIWISKECIRDKFCCSKENENMDL